MKLSDKSEARLYKVLNMLTRILKKVQMKEQQNNL